jgi:dynein intermediate chain, cytosolic
LHNASCRLYAHLLQSGLVTTSTDGKLSFWSLANLRDPAEVVQLNGNLSCVAMASNNSFYCGDESGVIFHVPAKRKHVKKLETHFGLVTAVSVKKNMVLSSGVDWTVKLTKNDKAIWSTVSNSYDYMCDVQWNPVHPSLFATASSNGNVGLWNLADLTWVSIRFDGPLTADAY